MGEIAIFLGRLLQAVDDAMDPAAVAVTVLLGKFRMKKVSGKAPVKTGWEVWIKEPCRKVQPTVSAPRPAQAMVTSRVLFGTGVHAGQDIDLLNHQLHMPTLS